MGLENKVLQYFLAFYLKQTGTKGKPLSHVCPCVSVYVCDSSHAGMSVCRNKQEGCPAMCIVVSFKRNL